MDAPPSTPSRQQAVCQLLLAIVSLLDCYGEEMPVDGAEPATFVLRVGSAADYAPGDPLLPPKGDEMANKLETRQRSTLSISNVRDRRGRPTAFDGKPSWSLSDPALGELAVAEDGLSATVQSLDAFGTLVVEVRGDAKQGDEVMELVGTATFTIAAGDVETFDLTVGEAEDVPA